MDETIGPLDWIRRTYRLYFWVCFPLTGVYFAALADNWGLRIAYSLGGIIAAWLSYSFKSSWLPTRTPAINPTSPSGASADSVRDQVDRRSTRIVALDVPGTILLAMSPVLLLVLSLLRAPLELIALVAALAFVFIVRSIVLFINQRDVRELAKRPADEP